MSNVLVWDIGGTKIAATVIDDHGVDLLGTDVLVAPTPAFGSTEAFLDVLVEQYDELQTTFGNIVAWGAAFPGPYLRNTDGSLTVLPRNIPSMRGSNFEATMKQRLPHLVGMVDNDLKLALWGEHLIGNARGCNDVIGFVHSTGVSTAVMQNGEMLRGQNNNAGEMACVVVEHDPAKARACDAQDGAALGHLEAQIRGPVLAEIFFDVDRHDAPAVRAALESADEAMCVAMVDYVVPYVAMALAPICQVVEPEMVLMHGSISHFLGPWYGPRLQTTLRDYSEAFSSRKGVVVLSREPVRSPLVGAAQLAFAKANIPAAFS